MELQIYEVRKRAFRPGRLTLSHGGEIKVEYAAGSGNDPILYLTPGWIDSHAHVYDGATDLGISVDRVGLKTGVHLVIDAGSAGAVNYPCFRSYVMPAHQTPVKAFLNISKIGLVTKHPYVDQRALDIAAAVACLKEDGGRTLLGIKVLSSGLIVEDAQMAPLRAAREAADLAGCSVMAHLVEGPPSNEETMPYLQSGDIITHCFHGAPALAANQKAARGQPIDPRFARQSNLMWNKDGYPIQALAEAMERGVHLDVGHGAGSLSQAVARAAIAAGIRDFSISTDAHIRNVDDVVRDLPHTMSKFLAFGMKLEDVIASVTVIPARRFHLEHWCDDLNECGTLMCLRPVRTDDPPFLDAEHTVIQVERIIEPVAVLRGGRIMPVDQDCDLFSHD